MAQMRMIVMIRIVRNPGTKETATSTKTIPLLWNADACPGVWDMGIVEFSDVSDVIIGS